MDPPYLYNLKEGTHIFRAKTLEKKGRWFSFSLNDALSYGENITEYILLYIIVFICFPSFSPMIP
jgi:hypothetical protein